jgi:uncharacterized protein YggE
MTQQWSIRGFMHPSRLAALVLVSALGTLALACEPSTTVVNSPDAGGISVNGTGKVTVTPDIAQLSIGVEARAGTVAAARQGAAQALEAVRASLRRNSVEDRDIQTQALSIQPEYGSRPIAVPVPLPGGVRPPVESGEPVIVGYIASNVVVVKVRNLDNASKVLDDAVEAGGDSTRVNGIFFTVDKPERFEAEAREMAMKDARARAEALAKDAGVSLGKARSIAESVGGPFPYRGGPVAAQASGDVATPLSPGESEVTIQVNVTYNID